MIMMMVSAPGADRAAEMTVEVLGGSGGGRRPGAGPGGGLGTMKGDVVSGPEGGEVMVTSARAGTDLTPRVH